MTYIASCRVGCEVYKEASKAPSIVGDSSSRASCLVGCEVGIADVDFPVVPDSSYIVCFIGCEVGVADVESPQISNRSTLFAEFSVRE